MGEEEDTERHWTSISIAAHREDAGSACQSFRHGDHIIKSREEQGKVTARSQNSTKYHISAFTQYRQSLPLFMYV
jgi:hypothetical protein